ncbi:hypothetical protein HYFRA_00011747 [Hymenoscyphus fraxineus]|uniref:Uncharacterized protein n=1 Tax=Hymenoscyphus fraxineus TaxID=746836 RepID=A0A9N9L2N5_9HELO|nr:hypothetical protein HYFRA_00011747 [Hymenoscyphus fraxineus]
MPSSFETTVQQILQAENKDQRSQPWKAEMKSLIETPVNDAAEVVPTGGACDVLKLRDVWVLPGKRSVYQDVGLHYPHK